MSSTEKYMQLANMFSSADHEANTSVDEEVDIGVDYEANIGIDHDVQRPVQTFWVGEFIRLSLQQKHNPNNYWDRRSLLGKIEALIPYKTHLGLMAQFNPKDDFGIMGFFQEIRELSWYDLSSSHGALEEAIIDNRDSSDPCDSITNFQNELRLSIYRVALYHEKFGEHLDIPSVQQEATQSREANL